MESEALAPMRSGRRRPWSSRRSHASRWNGRFGRLNERVSGALPTRADSLAELVDRARGLGCASGDMRLAYGWRRAVVRTALVAGLLGLGSRVALTGLFVWFVTDKIVPVTGFNVALTVLGTVAVGLVHTGHVLPSGSRGLAGGRAVYGARGGLRRRSLARCRRWVLRVWGRFLG